MRNVPKRRIANLAASQKHLGHWLWLPWGFAEPLPPSHQPFHLSAPDAISPAPLSPFLPPSQPPYLPFPIPPPPSSRLTVSTRSHHQHPTHFLNIIVIFHTIWRALHDPHTLGIANKVPEPPHTRAGCAQHRSRPISPPRNRPLADPKAL